MPQIPTVTSPGQVSIPQQMSPSVAGAPGATLARTGEQIQSTADYGIQVANHLQVARDTQIGLHLENQIVAAKDKFLEQLSRSTDPDALAGATDKFITDTESWFDNRYAENPLVFNAYRPRLDADMEDLRKTATVREFDLRGSIFDADLNTRLNALALDRANAASPEEKNSISADAEGIIQAAVIAAYKTPVQAQKLYETWQEQAEKGELGKLLHSQDPAALAKGIELLGDPANFPHIQLAEQDSMYGTAVRAQRTLSTQIEQAGADLKETTARNELNSIHPNDYEAQLEFLDNPEKNIESFKKWGLADADGTVDSKAVTQTRDAIKEVQADGNAKTSKASDDAEKQVTDALATNDFVKARQLLKQNMPVFVKGKAEELSNAIAARAKKTDADIDLHEDASEGIRIRTLIDQGQIDEAKSEIVTTDHLKSATRSSLTNEIFARQDKAIEAGLKSGNLFFKSQLAPSAGSAIDAMVDGTMDASGAANLSDLVKSEMARYANAQQALATWVDTQRKTGRTLTSDDIYREAVNNVQQFAMPVSQKIEMQRNQTAAQPASGSRSPAGPTRDAAIAELRKRGKVINENTIKQAIDLMKGGPIMGGWTAIPNASQEPPPVKPGWDAVPDAPASSTPIEPAHFPIDAFLHDQVKDLPADQAAKKTSGFTSVMHAIATPWMDMGYSAAASLNRGMAHFSTTLDLALKQAQRVVNPNAQPRDGIFDEAARQYEQNAEYWNGLISKEGTDGINKFFGNLLGSAVPGTGEFLLDQASNWTIPFLAGTEKAQEEHATDPVIGGLIEAAKTGTLGMLFKGVAPFNRYLQATVLGTAFGVQDATEAPKGKRLEAFGQGAASGGLLGLTSPSGGWGLRDIYPEVGPKTAIADNMGAPNAVQASTPQPVAATAPGATGTAPTAIEGTATEEERVTHDPDIRELTETLKNVPRDTSFDDRLSIADTLKKTYTGVLGAAQTATAAMKATGEAAWNFYNKPPQWTTFDDMFGQFLGARQRTAMQTDLYAKEVLAKLPDREQRAITAYMQANGDEAVLQDWADRSSDPQAKQKYEDALRLPDEGKAIAQQSREYYAGKLDAMIGAGVLDHGVENYVMQVWDRSKDNPVAQRLLAESYSGKLSKNPSFAKQRIFESYFDGEQAGYTPKDDRIGYLIAAYEKMGNDTLAGRQFVTNMSHGNGSDGRPLVLTKGVGEALPKGQRPAEAYLINPHAVGTVYATDAAGKRLTDPQTGERMEVYTGDYKTINHPALRNHKWVAADNEGNPIFVQGDVKVHPEIYKRLNNFLGKPEHWPITKVALEGNAQIKGTMLGLLSTFHQAHLGVEAASYKVNPFSPPDIDLDDPLTNKLIDHTLKLQDSDGMTAFSEGMEKSPLIKRIPFLGKIAEHYTEYQFGTNGYIPRLKLQVAKELYARNVKRYPQLSDDQVLKLTADETNAGIAGLNFEFMGRSKKFQDLFRLSALAPNFLEAQGRSVVQAAMPYRREQLAMLLRQAAVTYVGYRAIEAIAHQVDPDKNKINWDKPFSATIDGKEYSLRAKVGDLYHLVSDPRSFGYNRLSPGIGKPLWEFITGFDRWGRKKDIGGQLKDLAVSAVPIAGQGYFQKEDYDLYQSFLNSLGVSSWNARTEAEKKIIEIESEKKGKEVLPPATEARLQLRNKLATDYEKSHDFKPIRKAATDGKITTEDVRSILERNIQGDVVRGISGFSVPDALKVWDAATDQEKAMIKAPLMRKWFGWHATADERAPYTEQMKDVIAWKAKKSGKFSIRNWLSRKG